MKCPGCLYLNMDGEPYCFHCGTRLPDPVSPTPQWGYFFAVVCGIIPVVTLGGCVPIFLGFGGASGCLAVSRRASIPTVLRLLVCVAITGFCWLLLLALLAAMFQSGAFRRR